MTATANPGIRDKPYIGGLPLSSGPDGVEVLDTFDETVDLYKDGTPAIYRGRPFTGACARPKRITCKLSWSSLEPGDIDTVRRALEWGAPMDLAVWLFESEAFWIPSGAAYSGVLARRQAISVLSPLPTGAATRYAAVANKGPTIAGLSPVTLTYGTAVNNRTPWSLAGTSTGELVMIDYVPLFFVYFGASQRRLQLPHVQGWQAILEGG